jgi:amino acid transporter
MDANGCQKMVKLSNSIAIIAVLTLVYWIISHLTVDIFRLRIFRETLTQTFDKSIIAIVALLFCALIINIMFNLSRIAEKNNTDFKMENKKISKRVVFFIASLPVLIICLFFGNYLSNKEVEKEVKQSAEKIIEQYRHEIQNILTSYTFEKDWIADTGGFLELATRLDHNFDRISVIIEDEINGNAFYLTFSNRVYHFRDDSIPNKIDFLQKYDLDEINFIEKVFEGNITDKYFTTNNRSYHLFAPFEYNGKTMVLFFTDRRFYGSLKGTRGG